MACVKAWMTREEAADGWAPGQDRNHTHTQDGRIYPLRGCGEVPLVQDSCAKRGVRAS